MFGLQSHAQSTLVLNLDKDYIDYIGRYIEFYEDTNGHLTIEEIVKSAEFVRSDQKIPNLGLSQSVYWARVEVINSIGKDGVFFNIKQPGIDEIQCYSMNKYTGGIELITHVFDTTNILSRPIPHPNYAIPVSIPKDSAKTFYFKFNTAEQLQVPISLGIRSEIDAENHKKDISFSFYAGLMIVMIIYNLFILFTTRERTYFIYVIYVAIVFLAQMSIQGYTGYMFFHINPLERVAVYTFGAIAPISAVFFMRSFLQLKKYGRRMLYILNAGIGVNIMALILALLGYSHLSYSVLQASVVFLALYQLVVAIILTVRQVPQARNFLVAWSAFLVGVIVFVLKDFEIVPYNDITYNMMSIGSAVECVLLSFALADRINALKREKEMSQNRMLIALKENERIISDQNTELERRVGERTVALEQSNRELNSTLRNLRTAQKQLIEAEKMASLGQMTAGIAHELNNPINFVQSNVIPLKRDVEELTELIRKVQSGTPLETHEKSQVEFIQHEINQLLAGIDEGSRRTSEIIRGLRIFSRMDRDSLVKASINECILSTLIVMKSITKGEITITKELEANLPGIECFPGKLNQVFVNLLTNAIHATRLTGRSAHERMVNIKTYMENDEIVVSIKDNGLGMSEDTRRKIFDPFFTTKEVGEGTGLGLSIVLGIVNEHNGHVDVRTGGNDGTEFLIYLPTTPESILRRKAAHEH